jgi:peroxiredoxin
MKSKSIKLVLACMVILITLASCAAPAKLAQAPPFTLTDIKGNQINLSDFKGQKAVLLIFFNNNIGTGQDPLLQSYLALYQGMDKLETLCVMNRASLPDEMKQYMAGQAHQNQGGLGFAVPLKDEDGSVSQAYGANPDKLTVVLINRNGNISFHQEVSSPADTNTELSQQVEKLTK